MKNKKWIHLLLWIVCIFAYFYMAYTLYLYESWNEIGEMLCNISISQWLCILIAILLMPINLLLESWKWQELVSKIEKISLWEAQKQVYCGMISGFITPYKCGDYPSRALMMREKKRWKEIVAMGLYGSAILTGVIIFIGLIPTIIFFQIAGRDIIEPESSRYMCMVVCVLLGLIVGIIWIRKWKWTSDKIGMLLLQSVLRYLCFATQFYLLLSGVGISLSLFEMGIAIATYYLFVTITPNMPIADAGIRGSWAMWVFSYYTDAIPLVGLSAILIWIINTILPILIGSIYLWKYSSNK